MLFGDELPQLISLARRHASQDALSFVDVDNTTDPTLTFNIPTAPLFRDSFSYSHKAPTYSFAPKWSVNEHRHTLTPSFSTTMGRRPKYTESELQDRRAQSAWEYRQRNRTEVNEKAKLRMQATRARVRAAGTATQLKYAIQAAQHRRDYLERRRRGIAQKKVVKSSKAAKMSRLDWLSKHPGIGLLCQSRPDAFSDEEESSNGTDDDPDVNDLPVNRDMCKAGNNWEP
ncbi:hypothetical protein R3P38DRAFT_3220382 [Favolaschia claudopus]|uniref:Uncharacterized protein n=1 Tax=Favolaschia claudopus TaxID=2862362 RepID=A0AAW0A1W4_9AGAR